MELRVLVSIHILLYILIVISAHFSETCLKYKLYRSLLQPLPILEPSPKTDTQEDLLMCKELTLAGAVVTNLPNYKQLFEEGLNTKVYIASILKEKFSLRKKQLHS